MMTTKLLLAYLLQTINITGVDIDASKIDIEHAYCLAKNVYYEAGGEDIQGQFAVASVTLNRTNDSRFPSTVCDVVKQTTTVVGKRLVCQFSWYCEADKKGKDIPVKNKDGSVNQAVVDRFHVASMVAIRALVGDSPDPTHGATHFHNPSTSSPAWARTLKRTVRVGNHDFYRLPSVKK